jgi:hypothetical protein
MNSRRAQSAAARAAGKLTAAWAQVIGGVSGFEPEDDGDLLDWMADEVTGMAGYAEALVEQYESCLKLGLDPVVMAALHDVADANATAAETMAGARKRFADHYDQPREFAGNGGLMPHDGRWITGEEPPGAFSLAAGRSPEPARHPAVVEHPVRHREIPGVVAIWEWRGTTSFVQHEVRCLLSRVVKGTGEVLASRGAVFYEIWAGDLPSLPAREWDVQGTEQAADLVRRMRLHEADKLAANRFLRSEGYDATEHADRSDCNCMDCAPDTAVPASRRSGRTRLTPVVRARVTAPGAFGPHSYPGRTERPVSATAADGAGWERRTIMGSYSETRELNGKSLRIRATPNGVYAVYVDRAYAGYRRTPERARELAEDRARAGSREAEHPVVGETRFYLVLGRFSLEFNDNEIATGTKDTLRAARSRKADRPAWFASPAHADQRAAVLWEQGTDSRAIEAPDAATAIAKAKAEDIAALARKGFSAELAEFGVLTQQPGEPS